MEFWFNLQSNGFFDIVNQFFSMKILSCLLICLCCFETKAQTRIFFSAGSNSSTQFSGGPNLNLGLANNSVFVGSDSDDRSFGKYLCLDLTTERRLYGPYYWLSGIKMNQTGYQYAQSVYTSVLKNTYISLPLLVRINVSNANIMYFDFGLMQNYLVKADLKESFLDISDRQNIASHLSRFSTSFYFEFMFAYRRFGISMFSQSKTFGTSGDFSSHWGLNHDRSLFLLYYRNFYFSNTGIKLTYRLR
jgi:hypothetical protein